MGKRNIQPIEKVEVRDSKDRTQPSHLLPSGLLEKYGILIFAGLLVLMLVGLFNQYIFFDRLFLFKDIGSDSINQSWPSFHYYSHYLKTEGIPKWSFAQGLGQNVFPAYMGDFSVWLLYLIKADDIPYMLVYVQMLKIFLGGLLFYLFLKKIKISEYGSIIGGMFYAFSGFMIVGSAWFVFSTEAVYLALMLYCLELLRRDNKLLLFPLAVALSAANNPVLLYLHGLLLVCYLAISITISGSARSSMVFLGKVVFLGLLGMGLGAFFAIGFLDQAIQSPRVTGNVSYMQRLFSQPILGLETGNFYSTFLLRIFGNDMAGYAGTYDETFKGWYNYLEAPAQYCSLLSLLLVPQLFVLASRRVKILAGIALSIALLPIIFPYFRYAFWLFSGDYFRTYSLFFDLLQILLAIKALELIIANKRINLWVLVVTLSIALAIVFTLSIANEVFRIPVLVILLVESSLLLLLTHPRLDKIASFFLLITILIELTVMSWGAFNERENIYKEELSSRIGYNDYTIDAVNFIHSIDSGFYRIEKNYSSGLSSNPSLNDALIQDFYSSRSYHQFNQGHYVNFLQRMNLISDTSEEQTRWINGIGRNLPLLQLISNKYLLLTGMATSMGKIGYDSIATFENIQVFKYRFFLPLGFTYNSYILESEIEKVSDKDAMLLKGGVIDSKVLDKELNGMNRLSAHDTVGINSIAIHGAVAPILREDTLAITFFSQNHIIGNVNCQAKKLLFLSIPFDSGWKAEIDGKPAKAFMVNHGFLGYILEKGYHTVELRYEPVYYRVGMGISAVSLILFMGLAMISWRNPKINYRRNLDLETKRSL